VDEYRAVSLRINAVRAAQTEARRRPKPEKGEEVGEKSGHNAESAEVATLLARRAELAFVIANRQAHLADGHGHGSQVVK
jgi:hypothetical protein